VEVVHDWVGLLFEGGMVEYPARSGGKQLTLFRLLGPTPLASCGAHEDWIGVANDNGNLTWKQIDTLGGISVVALTVHKPN